MTLNESIGRYSVRKTLRFEMKPVAKTGEYLDALLSDDEDRAAALNNLKSVIEAEHRAMIRRVFNALPDPLPKRDVIKEAFQNDPAYQDLTATSVAPLLSRITERCRFNHWPIPPYVRALQNWHSLFIKWHWKCLDEYAIKGLHPFTREWENKDKATVERESPLLRTPPRRKPSRNFWFDHAPFRMMFNNRACGMSWLKEDFKQSRNFLMRDGDRILVAVVPRDSKIYPYTMAAPLPLEQSYLLYEETAGEAPRFRPIPRALIDAPAHRGMLYLFELSGRGLRTETNLNAQYLKSLLSSDNFLNPSFHLDKACEFHFRKASHVAGEDKPDHFRQRFSEPKFFVTFNIVCNPSAASVKRPPRKYAIDDPAKFLKDNPLATVVWINSATGGYTVDDIFLPTSVAKNGGLAGLLAKLVVERDAFAILNTSIPEELRKAILLKFDYVVVRGTDPFAAGGVMRGYQLHERLFVSPHAEAQALLQADQVQRMAAADAARMKAEQKRKEEEAKAERLRLEQEAAAKRRAEREAAKAAAASAFAQKDQEIRERKELWAKLTSCDDPPIFKAPMFFSGSYKFHFGYRDKMNTPRVGDCFGDSKSDVYDKLFAVGIKAGFVESRDPNYKDIPNPLPGPEVGAFVYEYSYRTSENKPMEESLRADTIEEAYAKIKALGHKPTNCHEQGKPAPIRKQYRMTNEELRQYLPEQAESAPKSDPEQPPAPTASLSIADRLKRLNALKEQGLLTDAEYTAQRTKIISEL